MYCIHCREHSFDIVTEIHDLKKGVAGYATLVSGTNEWMTRQADKGDRKFVYVDR